ncbi:MAG: hypothetical protein K6F53_08900 [Lachnospiraceae bacterium]|nr:hypothetical protein [Lachnospiraceae bacterium]
MDVNHQTQPDGRKGKGRTVLIIILSIVVLFLIAAVFAGGIIVGRYLVMNGGSTSALTSVKEPESGPEEDLTGNGEAKPGAEADEAGTPSPEASATPAPVGDFTEIETAIEDNVEDDIQQHQESSDSYQIVILGDSIFDMVRDETGIASKLEWKLGADVYNLAIGGVSATVAPDESTTNEDWNSTSGVGIAKVLSGKVSPDVLRDTTAKKIIIDNYDVFKNTDLFIIEYGINDYLADHPPGYGNYGSDFMYFCNALEQIVDDLRETAPDADVLLCEPHFCEFYGKDGAFLGSSNMVRNDYGTLTEYVGNVDYIANTRDTYLWHAYLESGINSYTMAEYSLDGIHMTEAGRERYSEELCTYIRRYILKTEPIPTPDSSDSQEN